MSISEYELKEFQNSHPIQYQIHNGMIVALLLGVVYLSFREWNFEMIMSIGGFAVFFKIITDRYMKWVNKKDEERVDREVWFS